MRLVVLLLLLVAGQNSAFAAASATDVSADFSDARRAYESGRFEDAAAILLSAMSREPHCARCAHLLGRSYGRLAERADGIDALGLALKTRDALELAVDLDPDDPRAVEDLIKYYRAAPGFLGGSTEKARLLEQRLHGFDSDSRS